MNKLIKNYLDSFADPRDGRREYGSVNCALQTLNDALGADYRLNRLYEWLHGARPVPARVRRFVSAYIDGA